MARDNFGNAALRIDVQDLALVVVDVLDRRRQADATVVTRQQPLVFELTDIAADGLRSDAEHAGKRVDGGIAVLADVFEDLAVSRKHQVTK